MNRLTSRHNLHYFQLIPRPKLTPGKLGRRDCFAVELDHHATRKQTLRDKERLER